MKNQFKVSVSSRSYILSYAMNIIEIGLGTMNMFPSPLGVIFSLMLFIAFLYINILLIVSVSSRSYILSYINFKCSFIVKKEFSFRLLSELYSLLFTFWDNLHHKLTSECFRLLSELYSLLFK